jgi:hypothetical protein
MSTFIPYCETYMVCLCLPIYLHPNAASINDMFTAVGLIGYTTGLKDAIKPRMVCPILII